MVRPDIVKLVASARTPATIAAKATAKATKRRRRKKHKNDPIVDEKEVRSGHQEATSLARFAELARQRSKKLARRSVPKKIQVDEVISEACFSRLCISFRTLTAWWNKTGRFAQKEVFWRSQCNTRKKTTRRRSLDGCEPAWCELVGSEEEGSRSRGAGLKAG